VHHYAPPKAPVRDVVPEARRFRMRSIWVYGAMTAVLTVVAALISEELVAGLSLVTAAASFALALLLSAAPLRNVLALRAGSAPLWWNVLAFGVVAAMVGGAHFEEPDVVIVTFLSLLGFGVAVVLTCWIVEARRSVRIYSTANAFEIVPDE
jgi:hypothetical protein